MNVAPEQMEAYERGKSDYSRGAVVCPYRDPVLRRDWMSGWESIYYHDADNNNRQAMEEKMHRSGQYWGL